MQMQNGSDSIDIKNDDENDLFNAEDVRWTKENIMQQRTTKFTRINVLLCVSMNSMICIYKYFF